jgi:hypothetical protein
MVSDSFLGHDGNSCFHFPERSHAKAWLTGLSGFFFEGDELAVMERIQLITASLPVGSLGSDMVPFFKSWPGRSLNNVDQEGSRMPGGEMCEPRSRHWNDPEFPGKSNRSSWPPLKGLC